MTALSQVFPRCGATFISQLEHEYMTSKKLSVCHGCLAMGWDKPLKRCHGCLLTDYCSKQCQKDKWPEHKPFCNLVQAKGKKNAYLSALSQEKIYRVLVDSYRLRTELDHTHRHEDHGLYYPGQWAEDLVWVKGDVVADFQRYLDLAETVGILPQGWHFEQRMECLQQAIDEKDDQSIFHHLDQEHLITRYGGDTQIREALCILAELIVGYDGQGPAPDGQWYEDFVEHLKQHPEEKQKLLQGSIEAVNAALKAHGKNTSDGAPP